MITRSIYYPGLNGVRFIAALLVILDHLELFKGYFNLQTLWSESFSTHLGSFGVSIFFVLSGFLITELLLKEKQLSGINIKQFYIRRILRIWPLYYLLLIISFFLIPRIDFFAFPMPMQPVFDGFLLKFLLYSGLLANVAFVFLPAVPFANVLWSVAVEEQFYALWPWFLKATRRLAGIMIGAVVVYILIKLLILWNPIKLTEAVKFEMFEFVNRTRFSNMIIGGLGSVLIRSNSGNFKKLVYSKYFQIGALALLTSLSLDWPSIPYITIIQNEIIAVVVCVLLVNIATNQSTIISLETPVLNYLGKISYGLYIFHLFPVFTFVKLTSLGVIHSLSYPLLTLVLFILSLGTTILIAHISYFYFERYFLVKKLHFSTIETVRV
jgi:peptidoglycan/LPS O-acetylase OafA/YrhL